MPEVLRGNLAQLSLLEILKLLSSEGQSGRLDLSDGATSGEIFLQDGNLVHAVTGAHMGEGAIYTLMGWLQGDFSFVPDVTAPEDSVTTATEQLLLEGARRVEEWGDIKKVIPSTDVVFKLSPTGSSGAVSLEPEEWQVLALVNGARNVAEIAHNLGQDEFTVAKGLYGLVTAGLLEVGEKPQAPPKATINGGFFARLNSEFTDVMGPLGPVIIDDEISGLGETRESFPRDKVAELVERVSAEIEDGDKRARFQQIMLDMLRSL
jgi:hypothetical protein